MPEDIHVDEEADVHFARLDEEPVEAEPEAEPAEGEPQPGQGQEEEPQTGFEVLGHKFETEDEAREALSKGLDYTRKTQEVAALRKEAEAGLQVIEAFNALPPQSQQEILRIAERAGAPYQAQAAPAADSGLDPAYMTDTERALYERNLALEQKLNNLAQLTQKVYKSYADQERTTRVGVAVQALAAQGVQATPAEVSAALDATGYDDPVGAFWAHHGPRIASQARGAGRADAAKPKADIPTGNERTFDPYAKNADGSDKYTADAIERLLRAGWAMTRR